MCFVCVTQAQTGETDVSAEVNMKAAITAAEHVHSAQPEKVHVQTCSKVIYGVNLCSFISIIVWLLSC